MRAVFALRFALLAVPPLAAQQPERFTLAGTEVAIYNLAGAVTLEPGQGTLAVLVSRGGPDAARLEVEQGELNGRETLRIRYPGERVVYADIDRGTSTTVPVREDGTFGDGDGDGDVRHERDRHDRRHRHAGARRVRITGEGEGLRAHADLRLQVPAGREVAIYLAVGRVSVSNVDGRLHVDAHSAPVTASGTRGELSVDVGSGSVNVTNAEGALLVDTGSGPVEVSRFRGTELSVDTGSGGVTASDIEAGDISIETGSGDIRISSASSATVRLEAGSGSVTADLHSQVATLEVETGSGNVAITAPGTLGAEVELETASGDIETDFALQVTRHSRDHVVGRIGDGKGRIAIESGSGDVRLLKRS